MRRIIQCQGKTCFPLLLVACSRRPCSSKSSPTATDAASQSSVSTPPPATPASVQKATPVSLTKPMFSVHPDRVDPDNLPSADDIEKLLPTMEQLENSIPSAEDMEKRYVQHKPQQTGGGSSPSSSGGNASPAATATQAGELKTGAAANPSEGADPKNTALWPDCDTAEDIINEEKFGTEEDPTPEPSPQLVQLAWRALMWGTFWAIVGTVVSSCIIAYNFGFHSWGELTAHVARKHERDLQVAKSKGFEEDQTNVVYHFVLDLTKPAELPKQIDSILAAVKEIAEFQEQQNALVKLQTNENKR